MNKQTRTTSHKAGYTILETVIYFSMLAVLTIVVISSLMSLFKTYSVIKLQQDIETSAIQSLDKITRDIRDAQEIALGQSSFGIPESAIGLNVVEDGNTNVYVYYATSSAIKMSKNGVFLGNLTQPSVRVNSFRVFYINGTTTQALKIELNLEATPRYSTSTINKSFYTTVQLRN